ncbi:MAG: hypothetical protein EBR58_00980 [Betaproteobacteria bacterium]|nr:hypothetical protein [Betaproteobacteria bacterium]
MTGFAAGVAGVAGPHPLQPPPHPELEELVCNQRRTPAGKGKRSISKDHRLRHPAGNNVRSA